MMQNDGADHFSAKEYARRLYERVDEAFRPDEKFDWDVGADWCPLPQDCHANVGFLVSRRPDLIPVRGWWVTDYAYEVGFIAHSVVRDANGRYINITPPAQGAPAWRSPFLIDEDPAYAIVLAAAAAAQPFQMLMHAVTDRSAEEIRAIQVRQNAEMMEYLRDRRRG